MIRQLHIIGLFCALAQISVNAQNTYWQSVSTLINGVVYDIGEDTTADMLYIAGGGANGFYAFDGSTVSPMGSGLCPGLMRVIALYDNTVFLGGNCPGHHLMKWNGSNWDTAGVSANSTVSSMYVFNNELYVGGVFTSIGGIPASGLAKYNGTAWSDVDGFPFSYNYGVTSICSYNGELYIGGVFGDSSGNVMNIARWDGIQWNSVGVGFQGGISSVKTMEVFDSTLYIGGFFSLADGNVGNYIVQWNGSVLSDVGGGVLGFGNGNGQIHDLFVYHSELYACGAFCYAGGVDAQYVAKWDGINWCGFGDTLDNLVIAIGAFHDSLYIGGGFTEIDTSSIFCFAVWTGGNYADSCGNTTGIPTAINSQTTIQVFPNPSSTTTTFQFEGSKQRTVIVHDNLGREIWRKVSAETIVEFPAIEFSTGIYFYRVEEQGKISATGKLLIN